MIRAQAVQDVKSFDITEDDVDNYLIRAALADNQLDNDATSSSSTDQRRVPGDNRRRGHLLPAIAANTEAHSRGNIECQHGPNLDDKDV